MILADVCRTRDSPFGLFDQTEPQTSLKWVNLDKKNPKANSLTIARHLPDVIRKLLVIKEAIIE